MEMSQVIEDAKILIEKLNSPLDWAVVGGAAIIGGAVDGAINILPMPFFSPGVCALFAGSAAYTAKKTIEAGFVFSRRSKRMAILRNEANRCIEKLMDEGRVGVAEDLEWELELDGHDINKLQDITSRARNLEKTIFLRPFEGFDYGGHRYYGGGEISDAIRGSEGGEAASENPEA